MTTNEIKIGLRIMELLYSDSVLEKLSKNGNSDAIKAVSLRKKMCNQDQQNENNFKNYANSLKNIWEHIDL